MAKQSLSPARPLLCGDDQGEKKNNNSTRMRCIINIIISNIISSIITEIDNWIVCLIVKDRPML